MADAFLKLRQHTEENPVYVKANLLLRAIEASLPHKSPTLYYASILDQLEHSEDSLSQEACILLLACALSPLEISVIQQEFSEILNLVLPLLNEGSAYIGKYTVKILERLVQVVPINEWMDWSDRAKLLDTMVNLLMHSNINVRTQTVSSLVRLFRKSLGTVPAAVAFIEDKVNFYLDEMPGRPDVYVNILYFLTAFVQIAPSAVSIRICSKLASSLALNISAIITSQVLTTLEVAFASGILPMDIVQAILVDLLANPPHVGGHERLQISYIQCLGQGLQRFNALDSSLCYKVIADGVSTLSEFLLSSQKAVEHAASSSLQNLIRNCIRNDQASELDPEQELVLSFGGLNIEGIPPIHRVASTVLYLLTERFHVCLDAVLPVVGVFLQKIGTSASHVSHRILLSLDQHSKEYNHKPVYQKVIGNAANVMGINEFLSVLPLEVHKVELTDPFFLEKSRSWLLQVFKEYLTQGSFGIFIGTFVPISDSLVTLKENAVSSGQFTSAKTYDTLIYQIWELFPIFCTYQNDLHMLKQYLQAFSQEISKGTEISVMICKGLIICINQESAVLFTSVQKRFVPNLFNTYLEKNQSKNILELIHKYPISPEYANQLLKRLIQKVLQNEKNGPLMDLMIKIVHKVNELDEGQKGVLNNFINMAIESSDFSLQRKAYKLLVAYYPYNPELAVNLINNVEICHEQCRKERLKLFKQISSSTSSEDLLQNIPRILSEIIMCIRSSSFKARLLAKDFIIYLRERFEQANTLKVLIDGILTLLFSSIDNTRAAGLNILQALLNDSVPQDYLIELTSTLTLLLKDQSKEVKKATIKLLKSLLKIMNEASVISIAPNTLVLMCEMNCLVGNVRYFIAKLIKKIGYGNVHGIFPKNHIMLLQNVNRRMKRLKKATKKITKRAFKKEDDDEDVSALFEKSERAKEEMPREYHFLNPLDIPAAPKVKAPPKKKAFEDLEFKDGMIHVGKRQRDEHRSPTPGKKRNIDNVGISVKQDSSKNYPKAYMQFNSKMLNKRKKAKVTSTINNLITNAKAGVLKGLKARKRN